MTDAAKPNLLKKHGPTRGNVPRFNSELIANGRVCSHGHLARSCDLCDYERQERHVGAALAIARKHADESQAWRDVVTLLEDHDGI